MLTYLLIPGADTGVQWGHTRLVVLMARLTTMDEDGLNYLCGQREDRRGRRREREAEGHRVVCYASGCPIRRVTVGMGGERERRL